MAIHIFLAFCITVTAAILARWDGSEDGRNAVKTACWTIFWTLGASALVPAGTVHWAIGGIAAALTFLGFATGTGAGLRAGRNSKQPVRTEKDVQDDTTQRVVEKLEWPQFLIFYKNGTRRWVSQFWYDWLYMAIKRFAAVSGVVLMLCFVNGWAALVMALAGPLGAFGYEIGWRNWNGGKTHHFLGMTQPTQLGEAFGGAVAGLCFVFAAIIILGDYLYLCNL